MHTYIHASIHAYMHACMHTDTCVYKHVKHTYIHQHVQSERCSTKWQSCSTIPIAKTTCEQTPSVIESFRQRSVSR